MYRYITYLSADAIAKTTDLFEEKLDEIKIVLRNVDTMSTESYIMETYAEMIPAIINTSLNAYILYGEGMNSYDWYSDIEHSFYDTLDVDYIIASEAIPTDDQFIDLYRTIIPKQVYKGIDMINSEGNYIEYIEITSDFYSVVIAYSR